MRPPPSPVALPGVKRILAVGSGKGGVGKSTVAWYIAQAISHMGLKVGFLDLDVYGPSLPYFVGHNNKPAVKDKKIIPHIESGLTCMSLGFLVDADQAAVWRGPMLMTAVKQMIWDVEWSLNGDLDLLVVDLPPGTGDVPLTLSQQTTVDGALIVTTLHPLAISDAKKASSLFEKIKIPLVGVVENMSHIFCSHCDTPNSLFKGTTDGLNARTLGSLPFFPQQAPENIWLQKAMPLCEEVLSFFNPQ